MRKVGIVTFHFADNYGAVLQAYGLVAALHKLDVEVNIIDYYPDHVTNGGRFKLPTSKKNIRADLVILYQKGMKLINKYRDDHGLSDSFRKFRIKYLSVTSVQYKDLTQLNKTPPEFDVYITGSDQVWNPSEQFGVDPAYFLKFGSKTVKRISYAASFGKDVLPEVYEDEVAWLLNGLDAVSVREKSGVDIVNRLSKHNALWVPDPTFLVHDYSEILDCPNHINPYMFSYVLRSGNDISDAQTYIANKLGLEILVPHNPMKRWKDIGEVIYPTPEQWLGYIKQSKFVVTNSFHGTVFSVLFNKPFITIGLAGKKGGLNERAKSLLERLGLGDRLVTNLDLKNIDDIVNKEIDWEFVNKQIAMWRSEAMNYLLTEIK